MTSPAYPWCGSHRVAGRILVAVHNGVYILKFVGDVRVTLCATVDGYLERMFDDTDFKSVLVDLSETEGIDSTSLGILAKLSIQASRRYSFVPTLVSTRPDITRILTTMGFDDVFNIIQEPLEHKSQLAELPKLLNGSEAMLRERVLEAHRVLMSMNDQNRETFKDLVAALESEGGASPSPRAASL